ncbi:MAG: sensor histidine kinase [Clostridium sp.]|nr:sensor histidine kinase [Clostridium sp.]
MIEFNQILFTQGADEIIPNKGAWSLIVFVGELLLATSVYVFKLRRRNHFWLWLVLCLSCFIGFAYSWSLIPYINSVTSIIFSILFFFIAFFGLIGSLMACFKVNIQAAMFLGTAGYAMQHFTYKLIQIVIGSIEKGIPSFVDNNYGIYGIYASFVIISLPIFYNMFGKKIHNNETLIIKDSRLLIISIILIICTVILNLIYESFVKVSNLTLFIVGCLFDMVCCFLTLFIEFEMLKSKEISEAYIQMKTIWESEKKQLEISKENMDYMKILAHDLKHELNESTLFISKDKVDELNRRIAAFGNSIKTGNDILDLVIAERTLIVQKENINLSIIADGSVLSNMKQSDCYSLFMNIMDNAIDAVKELPKDQREISLAVRESMGMILIHEVNPFQGTLNFKDGLPQTTKRDSMYHGFGTKSIKGIVDSYSGDCEISIKDNNIYVLNILLPKNMIQKENIDLN